MVITGHQMVDIRCTLPAAATGVAVRVQVGGRGGTALTAGVRVGGHGVHCITGKRGCQAEFPEISESPVRLEGSEVSECVEVGLGVSDK